MVLNNINIVIKRITKTFLSKIIYLSGVQIISLSSQQKELILENPSLRYKHFATRDALMIQTGQIKLKEARFLGNLVSNLKSDGPIIEIGTLFGWSTRVICLFKEPNREFITVDNFSWNQFNLPADMHFKITEQILAEAQSQYNVTLLRMDNVDFYNTYSGAPPALIFIDADHEYEKVKIDIEHAKKLNSFIICGHDYSHERFPGVVKAVNEFGGPSKVEGSLWVL